MIPTTHQDVWSKSTEDDWRAALALLSGLPSRATSSAEFDQQVYFLALEGTTQHGLFAGVKAILQNALGHAFFPSPPEFRGQCDRAMEPHIAMRDRVARQEKIQRAMPAVRPPLSEGEKRRQQERMDRFYAAIGKAPEDDEADFTARMQAKYGKDAIDAVPENPKAKERMGRAA